MKRTLTALCLAHIALCIALSAHATERFVSKGNAGAAAPYDTPAAAAAEIQAAIDASAAGDVITVLPSASAYAPFTVAKGVTVRGATGDWKDVVVDAQDKRRVAWIANPDATLESATLTRGKTGGYAAGVHIGGGALRNCRVTACRFHNLGGQIDGNSFSVVANVGGTLKDCLIDNNSGSFMYNGNSLTPTALGLCQTTGLTDSCVVTGNYVYVGANASGIGTGNTGGGIHLIGGTVRNSLVAWNRVNQIHPNVAAGRGRSFAGGLYASGGTIINNTFVGNSTTARDGLSVELTYGAVIASGDAVVENNLVADNHETTTDADIGCVAQGSATFLHNCAKNAAGLPGEGNVEAAGAVYRVRGGVVESSASSPCHDAGRNEDWMAEATDLYGRPRVFGKCVDIGAAECQAGAGTKIMLR